MTAVGRGGFKVLRMKTLATAEETNGAFELVEDRRNQGEGAAPHVHRNSEEAFYVLEGRFTFGRGPDEIVAEQGDFVLIPRGTRHFYRAITDGSRVLILYAPPGRFDDLLREIDSLLARGMTSAQALAAIRGKYDSDPA